MAGKRLSDNNPIEINGSGFQAGDAFPVCHENEDRKLYILDLLKALRDGKNLEGGCTFATSAQLSEFVAPDGGTYKIEDGQLKQLNQDDGQYYTIAVAKNGGKTLKWNNLFAVSVNANGQIQYPENFASINGLVTAENGQLKNLNAGVGLIGYSYNGGTETTWKLDLEFLSAFVNSIVSQRQLLKAPTGESIKLSARVIDGVAVIEPEIVEESE